MNALSLPTPIPRRFDKQVWGIRILLGALLLGAAVFLVLPVGTLLWRSMENSSGQWVGADNFVLWLNTPSLMDSALRSLKLASLSAVICTVLAYVYAYALNLSCMPFKRFFKGVALLPLLAPSLLMAIGLVYLFGNQGLLKDIFPGSLYGERGIVMGSIFWTFPHALLILLISLRTMDAQLIESAEALGASPWRVFRTVILPSSRYGLMMTVTVVFILVLTDFGVAKVIGGSANVLATDIYKQVIGQQNFGMGAVVSLVLLIPAVLAYLMESYASKRQRAMLSTRSVVYQASKQAGRDGILTLLCSSIALAILMVIGVAIFASLASYWPYRLELTLKNYDFAQTHAAGWGVYFNSIKLAAAVALVGAIVTFLGAWLTEKVPAHPKSRASLNFLAMLPMAVPGLCLGLGYILFFNQPGLQFLNLYGTLAILVISTVVHFYSVAHITFISNLKQLDKEFEAVSLSMGVSAWKTLWRVHLPVCLPAMLEVAAYMFVNAMTTVSAVVFLYAPSTELASVAVLNMDDAGDVASAAALAVMIFLTAAVVQLFFSGLQAVVKKRTQVWRVR
jgi:iron(III) transport system permease protein